MGIHHKQQSGKKYILLIIGISVVVLVIVVGMLLSRMDIPVLMPKGIMARQERDLMFEALLLSGIVVVPVFTMLFLIAWKYRASNTKARYEPDWDRNTLLESIWWGIPCLIILILSVITWQSTHALDPYKPLTSSVKPIKIEVVSLDWKWLFIYPDQHIASVNLMQIPVNTPINLQLTSDAPMNSFWVPSLSGQIYTMSGMSTQLHLMGDTIGDYNGVSANISGVGFAGMKFVARVSSNSTFNSWVVASQHSKQKLGVDEYNTLARPSQNVPASQYALKQDDLYDTVLMKYMAPMQDNTMPGMEMN